MNPHLALAACLFVVTGIGASVWLFLLLKAELHKASSRSKQRQAATEASLNAVRVSLFNLDKRIGDAERQTGILVPPPPTRSGFNLSKRSQAIRMHRRGETPSRIAAALELPQGEVDLLLKVHEIVVGPAIAAPSRGS